MDIYLKAYINKNLGDDLFVNILLDRYKDMNFFIQSRADYLRKNNLYFYKKNIFEKILGKILYYISFNKINYDYIISQRFDTSVIIGGSMFIEGKDKYFSTLKKPLFILGSNFGSYKTNKFKNRYNKYFSNAEDVCFREEHSYELFKNLPNVRCASDIVFTLDTSNIKITNNKKVVISVIDCDKKIDSKYTEEYERKIIDLIKLFYTKGYEIILMSYCKCEGDEHAIEHVISKLDDKKIKKYINKYFYDGNIEEALNVMGDCQVVVGTRFHANILGLVMNKTTIPIAYSDKTLNVLKEMNFKGKIFDIRDMNNFNVDSLTDKDLNYKLDVSYQKKDAQRQFEKLDEILYRGKNND